MKKFYSLVKELPIFKGLSFRDLEEILKNSNVRDLAKDSNLFWEGDEPVNLFIVIRGWVKIYNISKNGDESVVKIIGESAIFDSTAILLEQPYLVNAQAIEESKILLIPAKIIRDHIKNNPTLANNMLLNLAQQNQDLTHQSGQVISKSSEQKVGWVLLDSLFQDGVKLSKTDLPYDKASLAARLGMTAETFSRSLKLFKKNSNIVISKNTITSLSPDALCEYCDTKTALKCDKYNKKECSHI